MDSSFKAKIHLENEELVFDMNDSYELVDALEFAKKNVESWFNTYGDLFDDEMSAKILLNGKEHKFTLQ